MNKKIINHYQLNKFRLNEYLIKAKNYKYKYINPDAVKRIIGNWAPISIWHYCYLLECFIESLNQSGASIMNSKGTYSSDIPGVKDSLIGVGDRLLKSNKQYKIGTWNLFNQLDFDIVHCCVEGRPVETIVKPYFAFDEFKREKEQTRVVLHSTVALFDNTEWTISLPLQHIMQGYPNIKNQHYGYAHKIAILNPINNTVEKEYAYIGITGRNWLQRMSEHFNEIKNGSNKLFHKMWREFTGDKNVMLSSELIVGDHSFNQIMDWEEYMVDNLMKTGLSLNMIPGGFKGVKFLHEHRLLKSSSNSLDEIEKAKIEYQKNNPRLSVPNILISNLWKDDEYATKIICGSDGRLSVEQIQKIRQLGQEGLSPQAITNTVNAKNELQVKRVLTGKTYTRIK